MHLSMYLSMSTLSNITCNPVYDRTLQVGNIVYMLPHGRTTLPGYWKIIDISQPDINRNPVVTVELILRRDCTRPVRKYTKTLDASYVYKKITKKDLNYEISNIRTISDFKIAEITKLL